MKKLLLLLVAIAPLLVCSCKKECSCEKECSWENEANNILSGCTYATSKYPRYFLEFKEYGKGEKYEKFEDGRETTRVKFTYIYNIYTHPSLVVKSEDGEISAFTMADDLHKLNKVGYTTMYYLVE